MRRLLPALVMFASATSAWAQVPAGPEFRANTYTTERQVGPRLAIDTNGDFIVAWDGRQDGGGIFGQRYAANGSPMGGEFRVNAPFTGAQQRVHAAFGHRGSFLLTWSQAPIPQEFDVFTRFFHGDGTPAGPEFQVNASTYGIQYHSVVTSLSNGEFVVAWSNYEYLSIDARRFDRNGMAVGSEFTVSAGLTLFPAIASWPGGYIVVWRELAGAGTDIVGRRFDNAGQPLGPHFRANSGSGALDYPYVAIAENGSFIVSWQDPGADGSAEGVEARLFTSGGTPIGSEFLVNVYTTGVQAFPTVAADRLGNFVVTWTQFQSPNSELFARRFDASGAPRGGEFRVNTYTTSNQVVSVVASDQVGNFVISWYSQGQDGSLYGAFGQRFGGLRPAAAAVDATSSPQSDGNRVLEAGETVGFAPSWRNVNGAAQTFGGVLIGLTGPSGATYTIADGTAVYGTVANGATAACSDCYGVSVSAPPSRPAAHWDVTAAESITPDSQGQRKGWRLHVGESFTDVARGSPFYPFVETLLHTGVTSGCAGAAYCPQGGALREQMPVFVLVAKEGPGYTPPACGAPMFADVPAGSPYCRWIEELARRGVVGGCGGGNYCGSAPVTREQMPVFVLRTLDPALEPPACTDPMFSDVPADSAYCRWIEELARRGVVSGCAPGRFCPLDPVSREQMAVFIAAGFGLQLYGP